MSALSIAVVVGSIRKDSYNRRFAEALARLAPAGGIMLMLGWVLWAIDAIRR